MSKQLWILAALCAALFLGYKFLLGSHPIDWKDKNSISSIPQEPAPKAAQLTESKAASIPASTAIRTTNGLDVTVLAPVPGITAAKQFPASPLPTDWNQGFEAYNTGSQGRPLYQGEPVSAYVEAAGKKVALSPDQQGGFPRLYFDKSQTTHVIVQFPQGEVGQTISVSTVDGGHLAKGDSVQVLTLNAQRAASFDFTLSENQGVSRVNIRKGTQTNTLDFWAGPSNPIPQLANSQNR